MVRRDVCVGQLKVQSAQAAAVPLGFIRGSLSVPTVNSASNPLSPTQTAALVHNVNLLSQRPGALRYRLLPDKTDLNIAPSHGVSCDKFLPVASSHDAADRGLCNTWEGGYLKQPLARKCESLAVSALTGHGDVIDVVAPVDILKQIFKTPYSKSGLSVAVHRVGNTLILNSGPDIEEGEKIARRMKSQAKAMAMEKNLYSKFVQHSVHDEGPDSPKTCDSREGTPTSTQPPGADNKFMREQQQSSNFMPKDSDMPPRQSASENFLRVLYWQFQKLRMLVGSDLLLFSNEKHAAVSLHLMETGRQVTPLMWLDAWLDNVMASIPELAVCYHLNGVVQGYELLKTDDIYLLKGLSEDGTAFFSPHVVQQNASSVLRFLQENCKQDPGTYWLFKDAGKDLMQLFDLSVISKTRNTCGDKEAEECGTLPFSRNRSNGHYSLPLAMLLYRLANRLSQSKDPADRMKCAKLFGKCLEYMDEQEHLVIQASAHEHAARLILACYKDNEEQDLRKPALELPSIESNATAGGLQEDSASESVIRSSEVEDCREIMPGNVTNGGHANSTPTDLVLANASSVVEALSSLSLVSDPVPHVVQALADPVSARLAAVHHIWQAIKSLRRQRLLQAAEEKRVASGPKLNSHSHYTECVCGEPECVAICDFRDIEVGVGMDAKLWQLLLLLGESYLTLAQAYKKDGQFSCILKAAELACRVRGSAPRSDKEREDSSKASSEVHKGLFWGQVWGLVGDVFVEVQRSLGDSDVVKHQEVEELKMVQEVMKEVKRLKKKVGQFQGNCEICSLTSCSCQSDRASSGISASSSVSYSGKYARKHVKKSSSKNGIERDNNSSEAAIAKVTKPETIIEMNPDIFAYLRRPVVKDSEKNLAAASECYSAAVVALADSIHLRDYESALRKKGWAYNELGRRRLAQDNLKSADAAFETAIVAFRAVKDLPNIVLVYYNQGYGRRAVAEVFASQLSKWEEFQLPHSYYGFLKTVGEARFHYQEALEFFGKCTKQLLAGGDGVERTMPGLRKEVHTQLAHTYLKLGMLLVKEDKFLNTNCEPRAGNELDYERKAGISSEEAISKALMLYKSLGTLCAQEAAYAQFQLGCQLGDSCLFAVAVLRANVSDYHKRDKLLHLANRLASMVDPLRQKELEFYFANTDYFMVLEQLMIKLLEDFTSMADGYWQEALEYYHANTHPDMFLQILMKRSALCLGVARVFLTFGGQEKALVHLLEGCRAVKFNEKVAPKTSDGFTKQLQELLLIMHGAASEPDKSNAPESIYAILGLDIRAPRRMSPKARDVERLKQMYGSALKLTGGNDLGVLYSMWYS